MPRIGHCEEWSIKEWIFTLGSMPIAEVVHLDLGEAYTRREAHVLKLENGKYALIVEEGCSCYTAANAEIELFPSEFKAMRAFDRWAKSKRELGYR